MHETVKGVFDLVNEDDRGTWCLPKCQEDSQTPHAPSDIDDASKLLVSPASPSCFKHNYSATHPRFGFDFTEDGDGGSEFRGHRTSEKLNMVPPELPGKMKVRVYLLTSFNSAQLTYRVSYDRLTAH